MPEMTRFLWCSLLLVPVACSAGAKDAGAAPSALVAQTGERGPLSAQDTPAPSSLVRREPAQAAQAPSKGADQTPQSTPENRDSEAPFSGSFILRWAPDASARITVRRTEKGTANASSVDPTRFNLDTTYRNGALASCALRTENGPPVDASCAATGNRLVVELGGSASAEGSLVFEFEAAREGQYSGAVFMRSPVIPGSKARIGTASLQRLR